MMFEHIADQLRFFRVIPNVQNCFDWHVVHPVYLHGVACTSADMHRCISDAMTGMRCWIISYARVADYAYLHIDTFDMN